MDSNELAEWMAFDSIEWIGERRADLRAGIISAATMNAQGAKKKSGGDITALDFMPFMERPKASNIQELRKWFEQKAKKK